VEEQVFIGTHTFLIMDKHYFLFCGKKDTAYLGSFSGCGYGISSSLSFTSAVKAFNDYEVNGNQVSSPFPFS
jgi:hypothetical protein